MNTAVHEEVVQSAPVAETADLVEYVSTRLSECGHPNPQGWENGLHRDAYSPPDLGTQRFLVNRQLRQLLGAVPKNTTQIRFCLVETGTGEDWKRLFESMVLPCMIQYTIPQASYAA